MKKLIMLLVMLLVGVGYSATKVGSYQVKDEGITFYYECDSVAPIDFNDANSCVSVKPNGRTFEFTGSLYDITIDPNGSDTSWTVVISYDPPEPVGVTSVAKIYQLCTITADSNEHTYAIPVSDSASNPFGGPKVLGKIYIGIKNTTHTLSDNIKIYLHGGWK